MSSRRLLESAAWAAIAHGLERGSLVVMSIILSRTVGASEFAVYGYFQLTVSMVSAYSALGLSVAASKFSAEIGYVRGERLPPLGSLWILSMAAALTLAIFLLWAPSSWVDAGLDFPRWLLAIGVFTVAMGMVPSGGVLGLERYRQACMVAAVSASIGIIGSVIAGMTDDIKVAMGAFVLAGTVQAVGNGLIIVKETGLNRLRRMCRFGKPDLARIAGLAGPLTAMTLVSASGSWLVGRIILEEENNHFEYKLYIIGLQWFALAMMVPGVMSRVILPRFVRAQLSHQTHDSMRPKELVWKGIGVSFFAALLVCSVVVSLNSWIWGLYGVSYHHGIWLIGFFMLAGVIMAPVNSIGNAVIADDGQWVWFALVSVSFVFLIGFATLLAGHGAFGAAVSFIGWAGVMLVLAVLLGKQRELI